jgi:hypothetical protein
MGDGVAEGSCNADWAYILQVANKPRDKEMKKITFLMKYWFEE